MTNKIIKEKYYRPDKIFNVQSVTDINAQKKMKNKLYNSILDTIGNTPVVKLKNIGDNLNNLYVKCEFMNPAGSIKDRIAIRMVEDAEKKGLIKPGSTLIEATSGNTGIGLAMVCAVKGYNLIITMPEKNSYEKQVLLESFGAKIYRTPNTHRDDERSYISLAKKLSLEIPNSYILNQFSNHINPQTHYNTTAEEIIRDFDGNIDVIIISMGTGGTITGISKRIKEYNPNIKIIGVDPLGSLMTGKIKKPYFVEGIGSDFVPEIFNPQLIDEIIYTEDQASFTMARRLIAEEGILAGGSSGSAVYAMVEYMNQYKQKNALAILPDSARNYLTKFVDPRWKIKYNS